ncbi:unnamed protein product, partial [Effrenium voratum]
MANQISACALQLLLAMPVQRRGADCIDVLQTGVLNKENKKFFAAVLHCTGDWVWLAK